MLNLLRKSFQLECQPRIVLLVRSRVYFFSSTHMHTQNTFFFFNKAKKIKLNEISIMKHYCYKNGCWFCYVSWKRLYQVSPRSRNFYFSVPNFICKFNEFLRKIKTLFDVNFTESSLTSQTMRCQKRKKNFSFSWLSHNLSGQINLQLPDKWQFCFLYIPLTTNQRTKRNDDDEDGEEKSVLVHY